MSLGVLKCLIAALVSMYAASAWPSATHSEEVAVDLVGVGKLEIVVPSNLGADYYENKKDDDKRIDIKNENIFLNYSGTYQRGIFERLWDFKGHFWQGYIGELLAQIWIIKLRKKETMGVAMRPLPLNERITLNGTVWCKSSTKFNKNGGAIFYSMPLVSDRYLRVEFHFEDDGNGENISWRSKAMKYVEAMVQSLKLELKSTAGSAQ